MERERRSALSLLSSLLSLSLYSDKADLPDRHLLSCAFSALPARSDSSISRLVASPRLRAWVINLDAPNSLISSSLATAVQQSNVGPVPHLGWEIVGTDYFTASESGKNVREEIMHRVVEEEAWIAVVGSFPCLLLPS
jgi:hypothetical protein